MRYTIKNYITGEIYESDNFEAMKELLLNIIEEEPCSNIKYDENNYMWEINRPIYK